MRIYIYFIFVNLLFLSCNESHKKNSYPETKKIPVTDIYLIPPNYDSMIAKLITTAQTREGAIHKMKRALEEFIIEGVKTTIPFHLKLMSDPGYLSGKYTTKFMENFKMED